MHSIRVSKSTKSAALAIFFVLCGALPAFAQAMPSTIEQEVLIKNSLLTFNDANVTGNYTVLHDKLSKPFKEQFTADQLKDAFKQFSEKHIDIDIVAAKPITSDGNEKIDSDGVLKLDGYIAVTDTRKVTYHLKFIRSEGEWKLLGLNVNL